MPTGDVLNQDESDESVQGSCGGGSSGVRFSGRSSPGGSLSWRGGRSAEIVTVQPSSRSRRARTRAVSSVTVQVKATVPCSACSLTFPVPSATAPPGRRPSTSGSLASRPIPGKAASPSRAARGPDPVRFARREADVGHGTIRVGDLAVTALCDVEVDFPRSLEEAFPDVPPGSWPTIDAAHPGLVGADHRWHFHDHSFLVRAERTILLFDTGVGPPETVGAAFLYPPGGRLPGELRAAG